MESTLTKDALPSVVILAKTISDALDFTKSIYLTSTIEKNQHLYHSLCHKALDLKIEAPFILEKFTLDTNYYHCNINLACFTYDHFIPLLGSEAVEESLAQEGISSVEGLVFVSNLKQNKIEGVEQYLKYHKEIVEKFNPELLMCFVNKEKTDNEEELYQQFEFGENEIFVEIISDDLELVQPKQPVTEEAGKAAKFVEKVGVDRVAENLECHMWPNMVKKDKKKAEEKPYSAASKVPLIEKKEEEAPKVEENKEKEVNKEDEKTKETKEATEAKKKIVEDGFEDDDEDEEGGIDLAQLMETVRQFKAGSKNLSDEERRQQAADLLMKLVSNCKELQCDDDDDEDEDI